MQVLSVDWGIESDNGDSKRARDDRERSVAGPNFKGLELAVTGCVARDPRGDGRPCRA